MRNFHPRALAVGLLALISLVGTAVPASASLPTPPRDLGASAAERVEAACPATQGVVAFSDVRSFAPHEREIACAAFWGVLEGRGDSRFDPDGLVTRGQAASAVVSLIGATHLPELSTSVDHFGDDNDSVHEPAINALAGLGMFLGDASGNANPGGVVTRAQLATMLVRAAGFVGDWYFPMAPDAFSDDTRTYHESAINTAAHLGLVTGTSPSTFQPNETVRRDQMASFLVRTLGAFVDWERATVPEAPAPLPRRNIQFLPAS